MTYRGQVINGQIVLSDPVQLPEGAAVVVEVRCVAEQPSSATPPPQSQFDRLGDVIGQAQGLPADFAAEHDHYIHGTPRR